MIRRSFFTALVAILLPLRVKARALDSLVRPRLVGSGRLTMFGIAIFDAKLYAPDARFSLNGSFGLELSYLRALSGRDIVKRSTLEMKNQGIASQTQLQLWEGQLMKIFPNVKPKDKILGLRQSNGVSYFYLNDKLIGRMDDPQFGIAFFSIWLGEKTSSPRLRDQLLGKGK